MHSDCRAKDVVPRILSLLRRAFEAVTLSTPRADATPEMLATHEHDRTIAREMSACRDA
jgi:hypothetical protein